MDASSLLVEDLLLGSRVGVGVFPHPQLLVGIVSAVGRRRVQIVDRLRFPLPLRFFLLFKVEGVVEPSAAAAAAVSGGVLAVRDLLLVRRAVVALLSFWRVIANSLSWSLEKFKIQI